MIFKIKIQDALSGMVCSQKVNASSKKEAVKIVEEMTRNEGIIVKNG